MGTYILESQVGILLSSSSSSTPPSSSSSFCCPEVPCQVPFSSALHMYTQGRAVHSCCIVAYRCYIGVSFLIPNQSWKIYIFKITHFDKTCMPPPPLSVASSSAQVHVPRCPAPAERSNSSCHPRAHLSRQGH